MTAAPEEIAEAALIDAGLYLSWSLKMPLTVAGQPFIVPDEIGAARAPKDIEETAPAFRADAPTDIELARRLCFAMTVAANHIERLGLHLGAVEPASKPALDYFAQPLAVPEEPPPDAAIREVRGEFWIGSPAFPPVAIVRSNNGRPDGGSWLVVSSWRNQTVAWFPTKYAALVDAVDRVKSGALRTPGDGSLIYQPPQASDEEDN